MSSGEGRKWKQINSEEKKNRKKKQKTKQKNIYMAHKMQNSKKK